LEYNQGVHVVSDKFIFVWLIVKYIYYIYIYLSIYLDNNIITKSINNYIKKKKKKKKKLKMHKSRDLICDKIKLYSWSCFKRYNVKKL
jgi:ATP/ADP translocase